MLDQLNGQLTEIGESFLVNSVGLYVTEDSAELGRAVHATSDVGNKHKRYRVQLQAVAVAAANNIDSFPCSTFLQIYPPYLYPKLINYSINYSNL